MYLQASHMSNLKRCRIERNGTFGGCPRNLLCQDEYSFNAIAGKWPIAKRLEIYCFVLGHGDRRRYESLLKSWLLDGDKAVHSLIAPGDRGLFFVPSLPHCVDRWLQFLEWLSCRLTSIRGGSGL